MSLTIPEKASAIATFRAVQVNLIMTLWGRMFMTPEMEVKVLFGLTYLGGSAARQCPWPIPTSCANRYIAAAHRPRRMRTC